MAPDANPDASDLPGQLRADEARLAEISNALAEGVEAVVPSWIEGLVIDRVEAWRGAVADEVRAAAASAGDAARADVGPRLRSMLATDIDQQRANPLSLLRDATRHAHDVLAELGVPAVQRDEFAERSFPHDDYDLVPATWADVHPSLHELGITWGAAKAHVHKARHRGTSGEGQG